MSFESESYDLLVVGGGINGVGIARDAAGRGLRTLLCEQHDLASHTSSASTKLAHGGLRYLEFYDFGLVRKSLREREILLDSAPHICWPLRFVLPLDSAQRPAWMIRAGLFLYDLLAKRQLPGSSSIDLRTHPAGEPLDARLTKGFVYSDAWVDDARLVVLTAMDAREHGATVLTRTRCTELTRNGERWRATFECEGGSTLQVAARAVVNATGPWVDHFLESATPVAADRHPRQVKGSHIVVPRLFDHEFAYIFQAADSRIIFAIPYEGDFTLIGTTEIDYAGDLASPAISDAEISYLIGVSNQYFSCELSPTDVVWTFAGLRPLLADPNDRATAVTRDYVLSLDPSNPPLLSIYGGKLTTYRKLAEDVLDQLAPLLGNRASRWTSGQHLPGGDLPKGGLAAYSDMLASRYRAMPFPLLQRYARSYGTRAERILIGATAPTDLGTEVLPGLYAAEIDYLRTTEWAVSADDILFRRSKLGLHLPADAVARLSTWLAQHPVP